MAKKKKNGDIKLRIAVLIIAVSVLSYTVYHISSLFGEDISTIITGVSTETTTLSFESYIFRDEEVLYSDHNGIVDYLVADGTKVSKGDTLAEVYVNGNAKNRAAIRLLDSQIDILEQSVNSSLTLADIEQVRSNTADSYYAVTRMLSTGDTGNLASGIDSLLLGLNLDSVLTNKDSPVAKTLDELESTRESVFAQGGATVSETVDQGGYFYSRVDGYEQYFTLENLDRITSFAQVNTLAEAAEAGATPGAFGKLADSCEWKILVSVSRVAHPLFEDPAESEEDHYYDVTFTENGNIQIPMLLEKKMEDSGSDDMLLVFSTDRLPDGFIFNRSQSIKVELDSVSGIYVPKTAVVRDGNTLGVYILRGYVVHYRRIEPVYETDNYYLVEQKDNTEKYLGVNDLLITSGGNLFDGRILD